MLLYYFDTSYSVVKVLNMKSSLLWFLRLCNTVLWIKGPKLFSIGAAFFVLPNWNVIPVVGNFLVPVTSSLWHSLFHFLMLRTSAVSYEWRNAVFVYDWFILLKIIFIVSIKGYNVNPLNAEKNLLGVILPLWLYDLCTSSSDACVGSEWGVRHPI